MLKRQMNSAAIYLDSHHYLGTFMMSTIFSLWESYVLKLAEQGVNPGKVFDSQIGVFITFKSYRDHPDSRLFRALR